METASIGRINNQLITIPSSYQTGRRYRRPVERVDKVCGVVKGANVLLNGMHGQ